MPARSIVVSASTPVLSAYTASDITQSHSSVSLAQQTSSIPEESYETIDKEKLKITKMMMLSFIQGALREKEQQGKFSRYNELISKLSANPSHAETSMGDSFMSTNARPVPFYVMLHIWLDALSKCVSQIDKSCHSLVEAVLKIDWATRNQSFVDAYIGFLENLVSAHAFYVVPVLNAIVQGFKYRTSLPADTSVKRTAIYERNHHALQSILWIIPTCTNRLFESIVRYMPHQRFGCADHAAYVKNLYDVTSYVPVLRKQILALVISHMVHVDAHIQIELDEMDDDVEFEMYNMQFDDDYVSDNSDSEEEDDEDEDEDDELDIDSDDDDSVGEDRSQQIKQVESMVRKLDAMMHLTFGYLEKCLSSVESRQGLFLSLIDIFDRTIIKQKSRYTQFLLFYMCSSNGTEYNDLFLNHLMEHTKDTSKPLFTRVASAAYISSYVARAKFLEKRTIRRVVGELCAWCEDYVKCYEDTVKYPDASRHEVFYATMQAVMYIFCFRWRELAMEDGLEATLEEEEDMQLEASQIQAPQTNEPLAVPHVKIDLHPASKGNWCRGLNNMPRLISSRFNPLKVCSPQVVRQFAKLANSTHFMYVYTLLEKNKDLLIPGINATTGGPARNALQAVQSFFPFDPYKLEGSKTFIEHIYFEWQGEGDDDDEDDEDSSDDGSESEDEEVSANFMAMSISPNPLHPLNPLHSMAP